VEGLGQSGRPNQIKERASGVSDAGWATGRFFPLLWALEALAGPGATAPWASGFKHKQNAAPGQAPGERKAAKRELFRGA
jgi:hypothetical protein